MYFCLNAPHYHRWSDEFPPLQDAVVDAAIATGARLVVLENLYMYGPTAGAAMTESTPINPTSTRSGCGPGCPPSSATLTSEVGWR